MNFNNLQLKKILEYQYSLLILFLIIIALILNFNINKNIKLIFLVLATVICFFYPSLLIPFGGSIYILYLINSKKRNNIEAFITEIDYNKLLANYFNNSEKYRNELLKNKNKIIEIVLKDIFLYYLNYNTVDNPSTLKQKYRFIKNLNECYFFDINEDFELIFKLGEEYESVDDIYKELDFNDNINIEDDNIDEKRNDKIELLENEILKKLGLFFYKSQNNNLKLYPDKIIYQLGLSGITNNLFESNNQDENIKYNLLKKNLKELVILFFYIKNKDIDTNGNEFFNFNKIIKLEDYINIFDIFDSNYFTDLKSKQNFKKINNILNFLNQYEFIKNETQNLTLFTKLNKKQIKNLSYNNKNQLEYSINYLINIILDNLKNIKLFSINLYRIPDKKKKIRNQYIIYHNLSLIYCLVNNDLNNLLQTIKNNGILYDYFVKIYDNKKKIFNIQIENEKKIGEDYIFTSVNDIFIDNIFYYYNIKYNDNYFTKIFPKDINLEYETIEKGIKAQQEKDIIENPFFQLDEFERTLDKQFSDSEIKEKQEEVLLKYYELIDKDNYIKVKELNKIAEKRNEELKIKELSFDNVVDNYGNKVYEIIDDIIQLINNPKKELFNNIEAYSEEKKLSLKDIPMILYKLFLIFTKDDRILYSGIIFIIIGFFIYFISNETPTNLNYQYQQPSLFQRLL